MANKLELTWVGKDEPIRVEPRLLIENAALSNTTTDPGTQNMLIHGDNLLALKALESKYAGQVKCIYIDPPYNTGSAFEHYDDNLEHSQWLNLMRPRLSLLWGLLSDEGSLWISIDDDEQAYMKVLCDELFGRSSFIASIIWQKRTSPDMRAIISDGHDYILVYAKNREMFKENRNKLPLTEEQAKGYKNPDNDPRGPWASSDFTAQGWRPNQMYPITTPSGKIVTPKGGVGDISKMSINNYDKRADFGSVPMDLVFHEKKHIYLRQGELYLGLGGLIKKLVITKRQKKK